MTYILIHRLLKKDYNELIGLVKDGEIKGSLMTRRIYTEKENQIVIHSLEKKVSSLLKQLDKTEGKDKTKVYEKTTKPETGERRECGDRYWEKR